MPTRFPDAYAALRGDVLTISVEPIQYQLSCYKYWICKIGCWNTSAAEMAAEWLKTLNAYFKTLRLYQILPYDILCNISSIEKVFCTPLRALSNFQSQPMSGSNFIAVITKSNHLYGGTIVKRAVQKVVYMRTSLSTRDKSFQWRINIHTWLVVWS